MAEKRQLFVSCEHGGNRVPQAYQELFHDQEELLSSHRAYDPGALSLARVLAGGMAARLKKSQTTRLLVDLNRSSGSHSLFSEKTKTLKKRDKKQLLAEHYLPYREAVSESIRELIASDVQVVHLSVHSFTPVLHGDERNADLGLLYNPAFREDKTFCRSWGGLLKERLPDLKVRYNYPYRGTADGLVRTLRNKLGQKDYLGIELEINQRLLGKKNTFPAALLSGLLETLQEMFVSD
jgi:predicted N-formylglutamate amidohydrolase